MTYEEAKAHLAGEIQSDGGLYSLGRYLAWTPGDASAALDGGFSADDLEALAVYMRGIEEEAP